MANTTSPHSNMPLRDDNPSSIDLLGFEDVVALVEAIVTRKELDPVTAGVNAPWGGGKTTVLQLLKERLDARDDVVCILVSPWEYDGKADPTTALIDAVLATLDQIISENSSATQKVKDQLVKLRKRVNLTKALKVTATSAITMSLPSIDSVLGVFLGDAGDDNGPDDPTLQGFRKQFADLMEAPELGSIHRLVVLVDDLDRSLPDTVVETLEAVKLFLSVKKMAFVIAADEENVARAIGRRLSSTGQPITAHQYLEKIIQVPVRVPALTREQTEEYLSLLMLQDMSSITGKGTLSCGFSKLLA